MHEWIKYENYENLDVAKISVFNYVETIYNPVSLHQTLDYRSPEQFEKKGNTVSCVLSIRGRLPD